MRNNNLRPAHHPDINRVDFTSGYPFPGVSSLLSLKVSLNEVKNAETT